jgi:hypothetical protein
MPLPFERPSGCREDFGQEQQARRFGAVRAEHDGLRALGLLRAALVPVQDLACAPRLVRLDPVHGGARAQLAVAGREGRRDHRDRRRGLGVRFAAVAIAEAAVDAGRPAVVGLRQDRVGLRVRGEPELLRRPLEQHAGRLHGHGRARIVPRSRRIPGPREPGQADLPVDAGVVGLELLVGDGPVGEVGAGDRPEDAGLLEVDGAQTPEIAGEVHAAAADVVRVAEPAAGDELRLLVLAAPERLRMALPGSPHETLVLVDVPFVVAEVPVLQVGALLEHDHREAGAGQLPGHDAAGCPGPDDHEVHFLARGVVPHRLHGHSPRAA